MPQTLATGNIIELKVFNNLGSQNAINVCHFRVSATGGSSLTDETVATSLAAGVAPLYKAWMPSTALHLGIRLQIIQPLPVPIAITNTSQAGVGARAADAMSPQTAIVVTKRTALAGRQYRGRVYYPFWAEDQNDANGRPTAGGLVLADNANNYLFTNKSIVVGPNSVNLVPVVYRRINSTGTDIVAFVSRDRWATQRRRSQINKADSFFP